MNAIFADTFYWIALLNPRDSAHNHVLTISRSLGRVELVTTEEVLTEVLNYFAGFGSEVRHRAVQAVSATLGRSDVHVLPQSTNSFRGGLDLYASRLDKGYSLTDCISMATMKREGLTDVLTGDDHFRQEGFHALLR